MLAERNGGEPIVVRAEVGLTNREVHKTWVHSVESEGGGPPLWIGMRVMVQASGGHLWPGIVTAYEHMVWEISLDI